MLSFKLALKEIFEAAMASGEPLDGICDGIVLSHVAPLPNTYNSYITLGEYRAGDVRLGEMKRKFRELEIEIECCGVVRIKGTDPEVDAEDQAYLLAKAVRTVLRDNKKLVSTSYPDGLAIKSEPLDESMTYFIYDEVPVAMNTVLYYAKIIEVD